MSSLDQTPLAQAKASIKREYTDGNMYSKPDPVYDQVFKPLKSSGMTMAGGVTEINLRHPDPDVFDDRLVAMLRQAFVGILGGQVEVRIGGEFDE